MERRCAGALRRELQQPPYARLLRRLAPPVRTHRRARLSRRFFTFIVAAALKHRGRRTGRVTALSPPTAL